MADQSPTNAPALNEDLQDLAAFQQRYSGSK